MQLVCVSTFVFYKMYDMNRHYKVTLLIAVIILTVAYANAQDSSKAKSPMYFRLTLGGGTCKGNNDEGYILGFTGEFALQKNKTVYALGVKALGGLQLLGTSNFQNNLRSIDLTYGKVFSHKSFFSSISGGLGYISREEKGALLAGDGIALFGIISNSTYEKIKTNFIGVPISLKSMWIPRRYGGLGFELYLNVNESTFYGINFCYQFGLLRPAGGKKKKSGLFGN